MVARTIDTRRTRDRTLRGVRLHRPPELSAREEYHLIQNRAKDYAEGVESQSYSEQVRKAKTARNTLAWCESVDEYIAECMQYERVNINRGAIAFKANGDLEELVVKIGQRAYEAESVAVRTKQTTIQDENGFMTDVRVKNRKTMNFRVTKHKDSLESEPRDNEDSHNTIRRGGGEHNGHRAQRGHNPQEAQQNHDVESVKSISTMLTNNSASDEPTMNFASNKNSFECLDCDCNSPNQATSHPKTVDEFVELKFVTKLRCKSRSEWANNVYFERELLMARLGLLDHTCTGSILGHDGGQGKQKVKGNQHTA